MEKVPLELLDFGEAIVGRIGTRDPCALSNRCGEHFNDRGNRLLAEIAADFLRRTGLRALIAS